MKFRTKYKWSERDIRFLRFQKQREFSKAYFALQDKMWRDYCQMKGITPASIGLNLSPIIQGESAPEVATQAPCVTRSEEDEAGTTIPAAINKLGG
jgi:hypothetical protein